MGQFVLSDRLSLLVLDDLRIRPNDGSEILHPLLVTPRRPTGGDEGEVALTPSIAPTLLVEALLVAGAERLLATPMTRLCPPPDEQGQHDTDPRRPQ